MGPADQIYVMIRQKLRYDVTAENEADPSLILAPARHALLGVCPEQIAKQSLVWDLNRSNNFEYLFEVL